MVLIATPLAYGYLLPASLVLGQSSFTTNPVATSKTGLTYPGGLVFDSHGNLWVADSENSRVLEYTCTSTSSCTNGKGATLVLGQSGFTTNTTATSQTGLSYSWDLVFDSHGNLWVADSGNSRVLEYVPPFNPLVSVTVTVPGNDTAVSGAYVPISVKVVTSPAGLEKDAEVSVYVNSTTPVCPVTNATSTGLYSCAYQVQGAGTYEVNVTATLPSEGASLQSENYYFSARPVVYQIPLVQGWNLVSTPIVPAGTSLSTVLGSQIAGGNLTVIWSYQGGKWLDATLSRGKLTGTLTTFQDGYGYWIYMTKPDNLFVVGSTVPAPPATPPSYSLNAGWNLIGFKPPANSSQAETVGQYLSSISGDYKVIEVYNNTAQQWVLATANVMLYPGQGMWIYVTSSTVLVPD